MCGRYTQTKGSPEIQRQFKAKTDKTPIVPRYNIAPTQFAPVIIQAQERIATLMRWGLLPSWTSSSTGATPHINARAENLTTSRLFRHSFVSKRCLVPADGFFEWKKTGSKKTPFLFQNQDHSLFAFAGLWDCWMQPDGSPLDSFAIITTTANSLVGKMHDRMPVILSPSDYDQWLNGGQTDLSPLTLLLKPFPAESMKCQETNPQVNSVSIDSIECIQPPARGRQLDLFSPQ